MRVTVFVLAGVVVAALGGLLAAHLRPGLLPSTGTTTAGSHGGAPTSTTSTTSTTQPAAGSGAGAPVLSGLTPTSGPSGAQVTLSGTGFFSSNGSIDVMFNGTVTYTRCPTERQCVAKVPPPPHGQTSVSVQVKTNGGLSNSLVFAYR